ncbi:MAG: CynX/NimT family MFS transporter [Hyphomicrobiaceae bacterium]
MARGLANTAEEAGLPDEPPSPYRWVVLAGIWLIYATFGATTVSLAPLVLPITRDLGIGNASMGLVFGAWQLVFILSSVPCGMLIDRVGVRRGLLIGSATIALSGFLRSQSVDYVTLLLAVAVFGIGGPIVSTGAPKVVARWFRGQERGLAMGLYITGPALGSMTALAMTNSVLLPAFVGNWRHVLLVWAGLAFAAGLVWFLIARHPHMRRRDEPVKFAGPKPSQWTVVGTLLDVPAVRVLLAMSIAIFMFNHGLNNWLPEVLRAKGMSSVSGGYWATLPTLVGLMGSLTLPRLATPERRYRMLVGLCAAALLASLLIRAGEGPVLAVGLMLQGIARSSMMTVAMLTLVELPGIGERHAATAGGLFFSAAEIGGASGPMLMGFIHDWSDGFGMPLAFLSLMATLLVGGALRLQRLAQGKTAPDL